MVFPIKTTSFFSLSSLLPKPSLSSYTYLILCIKHLYWDLAYWSVSCEFSQHELIPLDLIYPRHDDNIKVMKL